MKIVVYGLIVVVSVLIIVAMVFNFMSNNSNQKLTLKLGEEQVVFNNLIIKYLSYGHENSSSQPDSSFSATTGVYILNLSEDDRTDQLAIYQELDGAGEAKRWHDYEITLISVSEDQTEIKLKISKVSE